MKRNAAGQFVKTRKNPGKAKRGARKAFGVFLTDSYRRSGATRKASKGDTAFYSQLRRTERKAKKGR